MSGYDPETGWCYFTPTKLSRYYKRLPDQPDYIEDRLALAAIPFYVCHNGFIHAKCTDGRLWTILSGKPDTAEWSAKESTPTKPELLTAQDLGFNLEPKLNAGQVHDLLKELEMETKKSGGFVLLPKGEKFGFIEEYEKKGKIAKRLKWTFETIAFLQTAIFKGFGPPPSITPDEMELTR